MKKTAAIFGLLNLILVASSQASSGTRCGSLALEGKVSLAQVVQKAIYNRVLYDGQSICIDMNNDPSAESITINLENSTHVGLRFYLVPETKEVRYQVTTEFKGERLFCSATKLTEDRKDVLNVDAMYSDNVAFEKGLACARVFQNINKNKKRLKEILEFSNGLVALSTNLDKTFKNDPENMTKQFAANTFFSASSILERLRELN